MSTSHKQVKRRTQRKRKASNPDKYSNGRWTEMEHYLFLLAVKEHGKNWKKIEDFVKTRSSTQARSHAQKVLTDDLMQMLDEEIESMRLKLSIESPTKASTSEKSEKTEKEGVTSPSGVKGKRKSKRNSKTVQNQPEPIKVVQLANISPDPSAQSSQDEEGEENWSESSEYSYPDDPNAKVFSIETLRRSARTNKKKTKPRQAPPKLTSEVDITRKDSVATNGSQATASCMSPGKTTASIQSTPKQNFSHSEIALHSLKQKERAETNKNGCRDESTRKAIGVELSKVEQGAIQKELKTRLVHPSLACFEIPQAIANISSQTPSLHAPYLLEESTSKNCVKNEWEFDELESSVFDMFFEPELEQFDSQARSFENTYREPNGLSWESPIWGENSFEFFKEY